VHYSETRHAPRSRERAEFGLYRVALGVDLGRLSPFLGAGVRQRFFQASDAPASKPVGVEAFLGVAGF
jgi:opacity protein-like surface antigen